MSEARRKVLEVYAEADAAVAAASPRCDASGRCCRFTEYGHTLFLTHFEAEILLENAPQFAQPVPRDGCPFQVGGLCTARDTRPLGCRIYFCDPAFAGRMVEITEASLARLKVIADESGAGWRYAPLHHFLDSHRFGARPGEPPPDSMTPPDSRHPLPLI
jgi:hypothetical protein